MKIDIVQSHSQNDIISSLKDNMNQQEDIKSLTKEIRGLVRDSQNRSIHQNYSQIQQPTFQGQTITHRFQPNRSPNRNQTDNRNHY